MSIFQSAIRGADGEVDAGYLAIAVSLLIVLGAIPTMCATALVVAITSSDHHFDAQGLGVGIGAVCAGFGSVCGAVGAFRWGDREHRSE